MTYQEIKLLLELCSENLQSLGCDPVSDAVDIALDNLEYSKSKGLIK
jgi:hypothetical protein